LVADKSGVEHSNSIITPDPACGGYIFNLKTISYGTGSYMLNFVVGSSLTVYSVGFQVRQ